MCEFRFEDPILQRKYYSAKFNFSNYAQNDRQTITTILCSYRKYVTAPINVYISKATKSSVEKC